MHAGPSSYIQKESQAKVEVTAGSNPKLPLLTCDSGLEGTAADVVGSSVLDADQVISRGHGSVLHLVALRDLLTLHLHFGGTLNGHRQRPRTPFGVDDEL